MLNISSMWSHRRRVCSTVTNAKIERFSSIFWSPLLGPCRYECSAKVKITSCADLGDGGNKREREVKLRTYRGVRENAGIRKADAGEYFKDSMRTQKFVSPKTGLSG